MSQDTIETKSPALAGQLERRVRHSKRKLKVKIALESKIIGKKLMTSYFKCRGCGKIDIHTPFCPSLD